MVCPSSFYIVQVGVQLGHGLWVSQHAYRTAMQLQGQCVCETPLKRLTRCMQRQRFMLLLWKRATRQELCS